MAEEFLESEPQQPLNLHKYWEMVLRRRWYFIVPCFVGWLAVWGFSWLIPSVYRSGTLILVEQPSVPTSIVPSTAASDLQDRLDTLDKQIRSRTRLGQVIHDLNLYPTQRARHWSDDALVNKMNKDLDIEVGRTPGKDQLSSFNIYFSADSPYTAQQVTNELATMLISETVENGIQNSHNINQFLDAQLEEARKTLAEQDAKVREFNDRYMGELPGQTQANLQILTGFQAQLTAEEDALGRAKQQNVYFQSLLSQYRSQAEVPRPGQDPVGLPAINATLDRLRAQLTDLSSRYTDEYPDVRKLKEQIARTEKMRDQLLTDIKAKANSPDSAADADAHQSAPAMEVESQLKANQIEIANRQRAITDLQAKINEYQGRLNSAPARAQELADLTRDQSQSQANYDSLLAKKNQSQLATSLNESQEGEHFRMIDPPDLPTKPFSPNRFKMALGGLFAGLVLGAASVAGREFLDDTIYEEDEFKKILAVDVMAEIPPLPTGEETSKSRSRFVLESAAACMLCLIALAGVAFSFLKG